MRILFTALTLVLLPGCIENVKPGQPAKDSARVERMPTHLILDNALKFIIDGACIERAKYSILKEDRYVLFGGETANWVKDYRPSFKTDRCIVMAEKDGARVPRELPPVMAITLLSIVDDEGGDKKDVSHSSRVKLVFHITSVCGEGYKGDFVPFLGEVLVIKMRRESNGQTWTVIEHQIPDRP
jgi:hypothetical protein